MSLLKELLALNEASGYNKLKAGIVPFLSDGRALFMVSSNPDYGGSDPAIAKGRVDGKESAKEAAIREGKEELGLKESNFSGEPFLGWSGILSGLDATYPIEVYAVQVKNEKDFGAPDKETARTVWMSRSDFSKSGRKSQSKIMEEIFSKIDAHLG